MKKSSNPICMPALAQGYRILLACITVYFGALVILPTQAWALVPVAITEETKVVDLLPAVNFYLNEGAQVQVTTAEDADGIVQRIGVKAQKESENTSWAVFALTNDSEIQIDRLLVAEHYRIVNSGMIMPDLGEERIIAITVSEGFSPVKQTSRNVDLYKITLNPGSTITFVIEMKSEKLPQLYLWDEDSFREYQNSFTLFNGMALGITGIMALFLTIFFLIKGTTLFPVAAVFSWAVLAYISVDFGFWKQALEQTTILSPSYRAISEVALTVTLALFVVTYLNMTRWHLKFFTTLAVAGVVGTILAFVALANPQIASSFARIGLMATGVAGIALIVGYAIKSHDRAIMLIPIWLVFLAWLVVYGLTVQGVIDNDIIGAALSGGLVLMTILLGFIVVQNAISSGLLDAIGLSDIERKALALIGSEALLWDWDVLRDKITTDPAFEQSLGFAKAALAGPAVKWLGFVHPSERDHFRTALDSVVERGRGRIELTFRMRAVDGYYRHFQLKARPVIGNDGEVFRCVGTIHDITEEKMSQERLMIDAVNDNLTALPNRKLFFDRLNTALMQADKKGDRQPSVFIIDIDRFKTVNDTLGFSVGDAILLTLSRRIKKLMAEEDTLARIAGDQFGVIVTSESSADKLIQLAENIKKAITMPIIFSGREVVLTASIGIAVFNGAYRRQEEVINDAEIAMYNAKRTGTNKIVVFKPTMRSTSFERLTIETDLRRALKNNEIRVVYQPIIRLKDQSLAGYEALMRWQHPRLGLLSPDDFIQIAEETGLIIELGTHVLDRAAAELALWQRASSQNRPLFVSVNISTHQIFQNDLIEDVKNVLRRHRLIKGTLRLELTESVMMENPEYAAQLFERLKEMGASVALDDFGTGHSSLAYLQKLSITTLKIDKTFVRPNKYNTRSVLLKTIVDMAHNLNMNVVAEGVETMSDVIELNQMGCDFAQGHVFGEPLSAEAVSDNLTVPRQQPQQKNGTTAPPRAPHRPLILDKNAIKAKLGIK